MLRNTLTQSISYSKSFYVFVFIHFVIWTLIPFVARETLPMDAIEGVLWGRNWALGYDKNPFLNGWLSHIAEVVSPKSGFALYALSQLCVLCCFCSVWQLIKEISSPKIALISIIFLVGMQYYNLHAIDFNDNTLELGLWPLATLIFYKAVKKNQLKTWIEMGVVSALCMMTKYYSALLLTSMAIFLLLNSQRRNLLKNKMVYLGIFVFCLLCLPHIYWLMQHDYITLWYATQRVYQPPALLNHLLSPVKFFLEQLEVIIPALIIFSIFLTKKSKEKNLIDIDDINFLIIVGCGPLLLNILIAFATGIKLRAGWGQPLLTLPCVLFVILSIQHFTIEKLFRYYLLTLTFSFCMALTYLYLMKHGQISKGNYPSHSIAATLENNWQQRFNRPLSYVVGPRWEAGIISFYSKSKPEVYMEANMRVSPWIDEFQINKKGGIFVWPHKPNDQMVTELHQRFPELTPFKKMSFSNHQMITSLHVAFLKPSNFA